MPGDRTWAPGCLVLVQRFARVYRVHNCKKAFFAFDGTLLTLKYQLINNHL
ncbi:hypothetical protein CLV60_11888 [Dyadobacter jiangsuensis]|uniref:Uncharacterized protein n=1 Tax=Dyadobacter jiangsuensis TaxID=1591085 RepID=A0A2P8FMM7_9BACT|nr:hypothetical protein CLV60_11888 [Dyadobacter jiangsuensis]